MNEPQIDMYNFSLFLEYIKERYIIHVRKDKHLYPLTQNNAFKRCRFININRKDDTQTKNVIKYIINNTELTAEEKILNIMMFRSWGIWETMRLFGAPFTKQSIMSAQTLEDAKMKYERIVRATPRHKFFTSAPYVAILKIADYGCPPVLNAFYLARRAIEKNIPNKILTQAQDEQDVMDLLKTLPGLAPFISYQMFLDMTYMEEFPFSDENYVFASTRVRFSIRSLFKYSDGLNYEQCIVWLRDNLPDLAPDFIAEMQEILTEKSFTLTMLQSALYGFADYIKYVKR